MAQHYILYRFNPFLVRASVYWHEVCPPNIDAEVVFQSLLSQGISLLMTGVDSVLIAFLNEFQSLLSQGISLLLARGAPLGDRRLEFQSLLSQGISLLVLLPGRQTEGVLLCFNPFLVRASVYCWNVWRGGANGLSIGFNPFLVRASVY